MRSEVIETKTLPAVLVQPDGDADPGRPLVILMHGLGADMYDLASLGPELDPSSYAYVFPNAPYRLAYGGFSWIAERDGVVPPPAGAPSLEEMLDAFVDDVAAKAGVSAGNIVIGGFSQGGGVTLRYGLTHQEKFRAFVVLSGAFRASDGLKAPASTAAPPPIFVAHGRQDRTIPVDRALETKKSLEDAGYRPEYHEYDMGHTISAATLADLRTWLHTNVPAGK